MPVTDPPSKPQYDFYRCSADFVVYGGAAGGGKTHALSIDPLRHCQGPHAAKDFRGSIFRRTSPQLHKPGGLVDHCKLMYGPLGGIFNQTFHQFRFPCGAQISLETLQFDKDLLSYQGAQFDYLGFDEAALFTEEQIFYLKGRCRSMTGMKPVVRLTCNPDNDSWLYPFLYWWIDPNDGFPILERAGVVRHFTRVDKKIEWYEEPQWGPAQTPDNPDEIVSTSATFFPATLDDNKALTTKSPEYRKDLMAMSPADRARFLDGCWLASSKEEAEWPRELFLNLYIPLEDYPVPINRSCVRMFTVDPSKGKHAHKGDYSAIVCLCQTKDLGYVDADLARRSPSQIIEDLFSFCDQPHHRIRSGDMIGLETLQFQELFRDAIYRYAKDNQTYALSSFLLAGNPIIQIEDMTPKPMRIRRLSAKIRNREFRYLQNPGTTLLLQQLKQFTGIQKVGVYDDGPDALEMATQLPRHLQEMYKR